MLPSSLPRQLPYVAGTLLFLAVFLKNAWVGDDAYILFRSLEQLLDGHGPRWNPHERVQVFTCPLWYWLLAIMGAVHRDHYLNSQLLSLACCALLLWQLHKLLPKPGTWLLAVGILLFSQAFFDFTSSGLENPLAYALLVTAMRYYCCPGNLPARQSQLLCLAACGLLLVTRHDLLLLVLPVVAHQLWLSGRTSGIAALAVLLGPLAAWTLFALLYYGVPLPNTAYAKLAGLVPREQLIDQGLAYFRTSLLRDFISIALLPAGILAGICNRQLRCRLLALGVVLHLGYVISIGGDFMRGRFFSWDVLACTVLLLLSLGDNASRLRHGLVTGFAAIAAAISTWLWDPPALTPLDWGAEPFRMGDTADNVTQERYFFYWFTALWKTLYRDTPLLSDHGWCHDGLQQRAQGLTVASSRTMGMHGFCAGHDLIVVDVLGITDPLLARMPRQPGQLLWRPGHVPRLVPLGYCSSLLHGDNRIADPALAEYFDTLRLLTQAPLLAPERLHAIWSINAGQWRERLDAIHERLAAEYSGPDGQQRQQEALKDCPPVHLPPALVEQLRRAGQ